MEAKEPAVVYGTLSAPIEEMQNINCELDRALEEVRQGNLKSYNSIDELLAELHDNQ